MIADLKPYADYKDSGQAWLGKVPEHWAVRRMKYVVHEVDSRSTSGKEQLLRVSQYTGVTQRSRADGTDEPDTRADSLVGYKSVRVNDLVVNIMLAWNGSMGVSRYKGIASPAYCVYSFASEQHPWYFHNLLRSPAYKAQIKASSTGVVESRLRLYSDDLGRIVATIPPPNEQAAIVKYLDGMTAQLDAAMRAKRKVIALLNEQKQAIIHRAVTRGLDSSVPLKPSGIPWLGDIPQHWRALPVRALFTEVIERGHGNEQMLSVTIKRGVITQAELLDNSIKRDSSNEDKSKYKLLTPGDIAYNKMRAWQGAFGVADQRGIISPAYIVVRPTDISDSRYYHFLFRTPAFATVAESWSYGIASDMWSLRSEHFRLISVPVPPIEEQSLIAEHLNTGLAVFNTSISRLEREIELLREYRTRLIADVVTGKLDVREVAAQLPEEVPLNTFEDAADLGEDLDTVDEEATA